MKATSSYQAKSITMRKLCLLQDFNSKHKGLFMEQIHFQSGELRHNVFTFPVNWGVPKGEEFTPQGASSFHLKYQYISFQKKLGVLESKQPVINVVFVVKMAGNLPRVIMTYFASSSSIYFFTRSGLAVLSSLDNGTIFVSLYNDLGSCEQTHSFYCKFCLPTP